MKKTSVVLCLIGLFMAGCASLPMGVQSCLYTADSTLKATAEDVASGLPYWTVDPNAAPAEKVVVLQKQKAMLVDIIKQAQKNTEEVVKYLNEQAGIIPGGSK